VRGLSLLRDIDLGHQLTDVSASRPEAAGRRGSDTTPRHSLARARARPSKKSLWCSSRYLFLSRATLRTTSRSLHSRPLQCSALLLRLVPPSIVHRSPAVDSSIGAAHAHTHTHTHTHTRTHCAAWPPCSALCEDALRGSRAASPRPPSPRPAPACPHSAQRARCGAPPRGSPPWAPWASTTAPRGNRWRRPSRTRRAAQTGPSPSLASWRGVGWCTPPSSTPSPSRCASPP
jgi:hypothetical protein